LTWRTRSIFSPNKTSGNHAGLKNASQGDREIFAEFSSDWERLAFESEEAVQRIISGMKVVPEAPAEVCAPEMPTERDQVVRVRLVQRFFRGAVLASYGYRCSVCRVSMPELLKASHIIPWSADVARQADSANGLAMCALHDRAFDRGLLAIDDDLRIVAFVVSSCLCGS
jgi:putative restriction endonuclease